MKYYKDETNNLFAFELDGSQDHIIAKDLMPVTDAEARAIQNPLPTLGQMRDQSLLLARAQRGPIIAMLDGMQGSANALGDSARALLIETAKQGLRDITKVDLSPCTDAAGMKAVIMARYKAIAGALPADIRTAFAQALL